MIFEEPDANSAAREVTAVTLLPVPFAMPCFCFSLAFLSPFPICAASVIGIAFCNLLPFFSPIYFLPFSSSLLPYNRLPGDDRLFSITARGYLQSAAEPT